MSLIRSLRRRNRRRKMRRFHFDEDSKDWYEAIYSGLANTGKRMTGVEIRMVNKILNKFELLGQIVDQPSGRMFTFLKPGTVMLEETEYSLAKEMLEQAMWVPSAAHRIGPALDWFFGVEEANDNPEAGTGLKAI